MRITIEHDDGRVEVRENVMSIHTFSDEEFDELIREYNECHMEIPEDFIDEIRYEIADEMDPDYYTVSEWMMDIIEDLVVRIKKERFELG